jgi:hypothetical protein
MACPLARPLPTPSEAEFREVAASREKRGEWFREAAEQSAWGRRLKPDATQCIGFSVPLIFAESGSPDMPYVADLYEHISFLGDLNRQLSSLPKNPRVHHIQVCHKCAVRFDPICAKALLFNTRANCFRAGLVVGK